MYSSRITLDKHVLNALLLNRYLNGADSMGFHRDMSSCLSDLYLIVSVSLGATREFRFRTMSLEQDKKKSQRTALMFHNRQQKKVSAATRPVPTLVKETHPQKKLLLTHGSVLIMVGKKLQEEQEHGLPKDPTVTEPRFNLNFRNHLPSAAKMLLRK